METAEIEEVIMDMRHNGREISGMVKGLQDGIQTIVDSNFMGGDSG